MKLPVTCLPLFACLVFAGLDAVVPAQAQTVPMTKAPSAALPYQIAPGDVLSVTVVNFPSLSLPQAMVAPDGIVSLPLLGAVSLAGRTVEQSASLLAARWKKYVVKPAVTVSLVQKHPQTVVFNGALSHAGTVDYRPGMHLLETLAETGGALPTADPAHAVVTHPDGTKQAVNLSHPETKAGTSTDLALSPGDVVYVPEQLAKVSVVGDVKQPGMLPFKENLTVLEAITASGGVVMETANLSAAHLTHNGAEIPINLDALLRRGDMSANLQMAPGDRLVVPEWSNRTYVFGAVVRPGFFLYKPGDRILDALNGVGGPFHEADLGKINVIHTDNATNTAQMTRVNLNEFLLKGSISGNPYIRPGDSLYIPDKRRVFSVGDLLGALGGVGVVTNATRLIQRR